MCYASCGLEFESIDCPTLRFIHAEQLTDLLTRLSQAQWVFGGTWGMAQTGIVGVAGRRIAKQAATDDDVVFPSTR